MKPPTPYKCPDNLNLVHIAAMASNRTIGHKGKLPWHLPGDLRYFQQKTRGHLLLMGRKTFDSLLPPPKQAPSAQQAPLAQPASPQQQAPPKPPLPHRFCLVVTRSAVSQPQQPLATGLPAADPSAANRAEAGRAAAGSSSASAGVRFFEGIPQALGFASQQVGLKHWPAQVFVCGGESIYRQTLPLCQRLYLTEIQKAFEGDTIYPPFEPTHFKLVSEESHKTPLPHAFNIYERS